MANFSHFGPVDHFLAWIKVKLPIRVKTEVCWGNVRSFPSRKSHFGGPRSLKIGQMANFDHFTSFDTQLTIFFTGTRLNSPKKFMIRVCWGTARSYPSEKRYFRAPVAFKTTKNCQFWPFQLIWHKKLTFTWPGPELDNSLIIFKSFKDSFIHNN